MNSVLDDVRVIELTQAMAGPWCAMLLGDLGADVIKVEKPGIGDQARGWGPPFLESEATYFFTANRNKRSIAVDYTLPEGLALLHRLIARADVLVINRPSRASLVNRKLDYESLQAVNPGLIYCSVTGYGFTGPRAEEAGYDLIAQGEAGLMSLTGSPDGEPERYPVPIADVTTGLYATIGILAALRERERSGKGQFLDMALFDSQLTWLNHIASDYMNAGLVPQRVGNTHASIVPYQVFKVKDKHVIIGIGSEYIWERFCHVLCIQETIGRDPRFLTNRLRTQHREELIPLLQEILVTRTASEWLSALRAETVPCAPINTPMEALAESQVAARGMIAEMNHPLIGMIRVVGNPIHSNTTAVTYRRHPPRLGEHTEQILRELGLASPEISKLRENKVI